MTLSATTFSNNRNKLSTKGLAILQYIMNNDILIVKSVSLSETEYLLSTEANSKHLLEEMEAPVHATYTLEEFKKYSESI